VLEAATLIARKVSRGTTQSRDMEYRMHSAAFFRLRHSKQRVEAAQGLELATLNRERSSAALFDGSRDTKENGIRAAPWQSAPALQWL
jgi:hypothetical protein